MITHSASGLKASCLVLVRPSAFFKILVGTDSVYNYIKILKIRAAPSFWSIGNLIWIKKFEIPRKKKFEKINFRPTLPTCHPKTKHTEIRQKIRVTHLHTHYTKIPFRTPLDETLIFKKFLKFEFFAFFPDFDSPPRSNRTSKIFQIFFFGKTLIQSPKWAPHWSHTIIPWFLKNFQKYTFSDHFSSQSGRTKNSKKVEMGSKIFFFDVIYEN